MHIAEGVFFLIEYNILCFQGRSQGPAKTNYDSNDIRTMLIGRYINLTDALGVRGGPPHTV